MSSIDGPVCCLSIISKVSLEQDYIGIMHAGDVEPDLPDIMLNWHHDIRLQLTPISAKSLPEGMTDAKVGF